MVRRMPDSERNIHLLDGVIARCRRESDSWKAYEDLRAAKIVARLLQEKQDLETEVEALRAELASKEGR